MRTINVSANGSYLFENIYTHKPSVIIAQITTDGAFTGTITFKKKALGSSLGLVTALYIDDLLKQVANAPIAGINLNQIVIIDSAGAQVSAEVTGVVLGNAQIDYVVLEDTFPAFKVAGGGGSPTADVNIVSPLPIGANLIGSVNINNSVALDAATLAALEHISIDALPAISGIVALDAPTLAALETIQIGSLPAVDLSVATLAALESIDLNAATLNTIASQATLALIKAKTDNLDVLLSTRFKPGDAIGALPIGANLIGKVDINSSVALALDAATLAALESIDLNAATLNSINNAATAVGDNVIGRVKLVDGAGANLGKILAASTAAALADLALVVSLSPNSPNFPRGGDLNVTLTAAVNTGATLTLPAAGAGLFHYITRIELVKLYSVVGVAAGAGVLVTSTNLAGNPIWTTEQLASPAGTAVKVIANEYGGNPLKSSVANTATTLVAPLQLQTIWRWNVSYYTAP